jgi:hypothetical protein
MNTNLSYRIWRIIVKKVWVLSCLALTGLTLTGCGKQLDAKATDSENGFTIPVSGTSTEKSIYWKTDADGVSKVKTHDGKFEFYVPATSSKFTIALSNNKDMSDEKTVDISKTKSIANYDDFANTFNTIEGAAGLSMQMPTVPDQTENNATGSKDVFIINADDNKLLGLNLYTENPAHAHRFYEGLGLITSILKSDQATVYKGYQRALKKTGQYINIQSKGVQYTFLMSKHNNTRQVFVHK